MADKYLIGIDIGTQGTKTTLFALDGRIIYESFQVSNLISPSVGIVEQDPEEIYSSVLNSIKEVVEKSGIQPGEVGAIGLDGQMAGIMGIDKEGNAATVFDSWLDTRCEKYILQVKQSAEELVIKTTGCPVTYAHGPKILWWKNERPDTYKKIRKFVVPTAYVVGRLTGLNAENSYIDYTHLIFSGFGDICNQKWSQKLLDMFEVDKDLLPRIIKPWQIAGKLKKHEAEKCGLLEGTAVVAGCGDQAAVSLGAGITQSGYALDGAGTASAFSCCVDSYNPDIKNKTLMFMRSVLPNLWLPMAYINGGGLCIRWFMEQFTGKPMMTYEEIEREAAMISPGSNKLVFLPHFGGRVTPNIPFVRGTWVGLNWTHTRAHLFRAILEGIAYEYNLYLKILRELSGNIEINQVLGTGGGAKSKLFNTIKADVLGTTYIPMKKSDTATLGSAVVAGFGVGLYSDMKQVIDSIAIKGESIEPNAKHYGVYSEYTRIYEGLFHNLENTFESLMKVEN